ncbi:MAG: NUDIX domain-containing protein [Chitinophagaceae bacterium]|nr:MAG: NUDIX domain-containing protein [Chitinophagaceae bacterium]
MKQSAGILAYRIRGKLTEYFLVHPGGPFWKSKDAGAWSIPKGEFGENETAETAARREFREETGTTVKDPLVPLQAVRLKSGKWIHALAAHIEIDENSITSNEFEMEWPPRSGKKIMVPEADRAGWFNLATATEKINQGQIPLLEELSAAIALK